MPKPPARLEPLEPRTLLSTAPAPLYVRAGGGRPLTGPRNRPFESMTGFAGGLAHTVHLRGRQHP